MSEDNFKSGWVCVTEESPCHPGKYGKDIGPLVPGTPGLVFYEYYGYVTVKYYSQKHHSTGVTSVHITKLRRPTDEEIMAQSDGYYRCIHGYWG